MARAEQLTFVCPPTKEDAGPNNNWMEPEKAKQMLYELFHGCMHGRTLYVIPYMMGHPASPYAKPCIQITDSVYVVVSMYIMTRVGNETLKRIGNSETFVKGLHSIGELDPNKRFIMHFPQEELVMSIGSGYGGNALLGKKCFSLRIASHQGYERRLARGAYDYHGSGRPGRGCHLFCRRVPFRLRQNQPCHDRSGFRGV